MSPSLPDPFERFAVQCGFRMATEALYAAPRDVLHPPADSDQYFLVTLRPPETGGEPGANPLRLVFLAPLADPEPPSCRDVLWWLAADAWAIGQAHGAMLQWAAGYGYPPDDPATARLFEQHAGQAAALEALLGRQNYEQLLALYRAEVSPRGRNGRAQ
jgi:hypothetical protein